MTAGNVLRVILPILQVREDRGSRWTAGSLDQIKLRLRQVIHNLRKLKTRVGQLAADGQVSACPPGSLFPGAILELLISARACESSASLSFAQLWQKDVFFQ